MAAIDLNDSVGVLDRYAPDAKFFKSLPELQSYLSDLEDPSMRIDYVSICTPNDMHLPHIIAAFKLGANVICEKPLALTTGELDKLAEAEKEFNRKLYTVLQLRVHEAIVELKKRVEEQKISDHRIEIQYFTSRGDWYHKSWKGNLERSGGLTTNIGIHFFDMLTWIFGRAIDVRVNEKTVTTESGTLKLERATVDWVLSIDRERLPESARANGKSTFRALSIDGSVFEFSDRFNDLHTKVYQDILDGNGCGIEDSRPAVAIAQSVREFKV